MTLRSAPPVSLARRSVVSVVALLLALFALVSAALGMVSGDGRRASPSPSTASAGAGRSDAVERTRAARTARIDATYRPAHGPAVTITGRTSLVGPESELFAAVGDEPPAALRVTAAGAWLRSPGASGWTPIPHDVVARAAAGRGWSDALRDLDPSTHVETDAAGRIVRMRLARDRQGGRLDVRFSAFGIEVPTGPP